jgi:hypothetical protein
MRNRKSSPLARKDLPSVRRVGHSRRLAEQPAEQPQNGVSVTTGSHAMKSGNVVTWELRSIEGVGAVTSRFTHKPSPDDLAEMRAMAEQIAGQTFGAAGNPLWVKHGSGNVEDVRSLVEDFLSGRIE